VRIATPADVTTLVSLMAEFYAESGFELDRPLAASAFAALLADERLGRVWLLEADGEAAGHVVATVRFGMEHAGLVACIDDLYVQPRFRRRGLAGRALAELRSWCESIGVRAMTVEVGPDNVAARAAYRRFGMTAATDRLLLTLALARPAHLG
jgi:GNAT superfamily N-acetyltransferase